MLSRRLAIGLLALSALFGSAAIGCASSSSNEAQRRNVVCEDKALTGSHIGRPRCYRRIGVDERRQSDQDQMRKLQGPKMQPQQPSTPIGR
jgi:hypothetical protein